jgi:small-conductance mechanosensitive channel
LASAISKVNRKTFSRASRLQSSQDRRGRIRAYLIWASVLTCGWALFLCDPAFGDGPAQVTKDASAQTSPEINPKGNPGASVTIDGRTILLIYSPLAGLSPEERADGVEQRIQGIARTRNLQVNLIKVEDRGTWTEIVADNTVIMAVTESDARAAGRPRAQLAAEYAEIIRRTVNTYREQHTWRNLIRACLFSFLATLILIVLLVLLVRVRRFTRRLLEYWIHRAGEKFPQQSLPSRLALARYILVPLIGTGMIGLVVATLALLEMYVTVVLAYFPSTRYASLKINRWTVSQLADLGQAIWAYLPNLVVLVIIGLASGYLIRLNRYLFKEIHNGTIQVHGFYPEWAEPTEKLVRLLILAATAVVIFPYLPGSSSPAFRGITVFLGVLLSLGSTSAVAHGVAGTILTYMRSFRVGDFVKIGDTIGEVVEKTLLVTRICTQKREIVTIPNGSVLGGVVLNYSSEARNQGVVFYTKVTIGYAAPWRKVHELLIAAALSTKDVSDSPRPFVLQSNLDDFYVSYELNAFTNHPENMQRIYSDLHQNIQDKFNEGEIEINSPHYTSLRDGNRIAVPEAYVPKDYQEPVFGVRHFRESEGSPRETSKEPSAHS